MKTVEEIQKEIEKLEMQEEEFIFCYECEENFHCSDAQRKDGCSWGLKTVPEKK